MALCCLVMGIATSAPRSRPFLVPTVHSTDTDTLGDSRAPTARRHWTRYGADAGILLLRLLSRPSHRRSVCVCGDWTPAPSPASCSKAGTHQSARPQLATALALRTFAFCPDICVCVCRVLCCPVFHLCHGRHARCSIILRLPTRCAYVTWHRDPPQSWLCTATERGARNADDVQSTS